MEGKLLISAASYLHNADILNRLGVYLNWFKLDPWFAPRFYLRDLWHPRSPLSSTTLVHRAFFSSECQTAEVKKFERLMPEYESLIWPLQMMFKFVDVGRVLRNVMGWRGLRKERVPIIAGEKDTLMGVPLMRRMAADYRIQAPALLKSLSGGHTHATETDESRDGVGFEVIRGSGHHIQNDLQWEECAEKILVFVAQL